MRDESSFGASVTRSNSSKGFSAVASVQARAERQEHSLQGSTTTQPTHPLSAPGSSKGSTPHNRQKILQGDQQLHTSYSPSFSISTYSGKPSSFSLPFKAGSSMTHAASTTSAPTFSAISQGEKSHSTTPQHTHDISLGALHCLIATHQWPTS